MRMSDQINELAEALAKAQGAIENAAKDSQNPHFRSSYANLASVRAAIRGPLSENGLAYTQFVRTEGPRCQIETLLLHKSGQFMGETLEVPLAKQDAQSIGSATSYGRRYALMAIVGIAASEDDDDGHTATQDAPQERRQPPTASAAQPADKTPAEEQVAAIRKKTSVATIDKFRALPEVKRDFDLMSAEDKAWVNSVDKSRREELEDPTSDPAPQTAAPPKANGRARLLDDDIPF